MQTEALARLIANFRKLPAVGQKTAARYAYGILDMSDEEVSEFVDAITDAKKTIHFCKQCGNYTDLEVCEHCQTADKSILCIVKEPRDILAFEKMGGYHGLYHVLGGTLDFQKGITAETLRIKELLLRLDGVKEVIIALDADIGGEMTSVYLSQLLKPLNIAVTRLAHGIPMGSEIEYADEMTLSRALADRKPL
jgi:recombination protein RecR